MADRKRKIPLLIYLVFLLALATGALAAAYRLYLYSPTSSNNQINVAARPVLDSGTAGAGSRINHSFNPEELTREIPDRSKQGERLPPTESTDPKDIRPGSTWVLNVISTRDPEKARNIHELLAKSPYRIYTYKVEAQGSAWYRVRVGFFQSYSEAKKASEFLIKQFQMPEAWIVTAGPLELEQYSSNASHAGTDH